MSSQLVHRVHQGTPALHYVEGPAAGPPLLLLHGVTRNWRDWEPLLPELMRDWHVFALDHRGHGQSERARDGYFVADYCQDAAALVRATFSEPVTVVGHSLGAMVALSLAAECAPQVARVVLEDPPFHTMGRDIGATPYQAQFAGMQEAARRGGGIAALTESLAEIRLPGAQGPVRLGDVRDQASLEFSAECLADLDPEVLTPLVEARWLDGYEPASLWPRVACPALLLQGDPAAGGAFKDEDLFAARRAVATHQHRRFDGVGHQIHRTCPGEFLAALRAFVAVLICLFSATGRAENGAPALQIVEISQEAVPYGHPYAIQLVGDRAYVANGEGGLLILGVSASASGPKLLGRFVTGNLGRDAIDREWINEYRGLATAVSVSGKYAFLLTQSKGYDINRPKVLRFDVSNPAQPAPAGECLLDGPASDLVAIDASRVCLLSGRSDASIAIVDFSEPGREHVTAAAGLPRLPSPAKARGRFTPSHLVISRGLVLATGTRAEAASATAGALHIFSLADPAAPAYAATCDLGTAAGALAVDRAGTHAYVASGSELKVVDLADPLVPRVTQTVPAGGEISGVIVGGEKGALATSAGVVPVDLSDPAKPSLGQVANLGFAPVALAGDAARLVVADRARGIAVAATAQLEASKLAWLATSGPEAKQLSPVEEGLLKALLDAIEPDQHERLKLRGVFVEKNIAYLATGRDGLRLMDVSDAAKPALLGHFYDQEIGRMSVADVKVRDGKAYLADLDNGLYIVDVSDPKRPRALAHYHTPNAHSVELVEDKAIIADGVYGLSVIDVIDAAHPRLLGSYHARDIRFSGATLPPGPGSAPGTIRVTDAGFARTMKLVPGESAPSAGRPIELVAHVKVPMGIPDVLRVSSDGGTVFLASDEGWNLTALDARDPAKMRMLSVSATGGFCHGLALQGNYAYATNNYAACTIFDVADPSKPKLAGALTGFTRCRSAAAGDDALGLCTKEGIVLANLADPAHPRASRKRCRAWAASSRW